MTIDTDAATGAAASTTAPASHATEDTGLANPHEAAQEGAQTTTPEDAEAAAKARESRNNQRRIDNLVRTRTEARTEAQIERQRREAVEAELLQLRGQGSRQQAHEGSNQDDGSQGRQQQRAPTQAEIDQQVNTRAEQVARQREVNARSNQILQDGIKSFGETFRESVAVVLEEAGDFVDRRTGAPTALLEAVLDSENPAALLNHLGSNPEDAESLRGLSPAQLGRRIAKLEAQLEAAPGTTKPPVHKPVQGSSTARSKSPSEMSDAEWYQSKQAKR
jgi:hypothetical protein